MHKSHILHGALCEMLYRMAIVMDIDKEKLLYLLNHINYDIYDLIDNVLSDSESDPHYSAVTATNLLKCYIEVMQGLNQDLPYDDVKTFFSNSNYYSKEEYMAFEKSREKESQYYVGKQF